MTVPELLARARSAANKGTKYKLGTGGFNAAAAEPGQLVDGVRLCDCSGYICWDVGTSRMTDHPMYRGKEKVGWISTSSIVADAKAPWGFFAEIQFAQVGCLWVYGDRKVAGKTQQGHVGLVTEVDATGKVARILHCSAGNGKTGDAIRETGPEVFVKRADAILVWYAGITRETAIAG